MTRISTLTTAAAMAVLMMTPASAQSDMLGVPGPISFEGQDYVLAWTSQASDSYFKQEYVPQGQDVDAYADMVLIEAATGAVTPMQAASAQVQSLESRRGTDPVLNYDIIQNEATGEVLLDFLISDLSADPVMVEWNAYRYMPLAGADGVALVAISRRGYGEDGARDFMGGLGAMRGETIGALAGLEIPQIGIAR